MIIYVATVDTRDTITGYGHTAVEAVAIAAGRALRYLRERNATTDETNTAAKIIEYFDVIAHAVAVPGAHMEGE